MSEWQPISTAPEHVWLRTLREGEDGENVCMYRVWPDGEWEWIDRDGRTTITHHTFLAPTHWMSLPEPPTAAPHTAATPSGTAAD